MVPSAYGNLHLRPAQLPAGERHDPTGEPSTGTQRTGFGERGIVTYSPRSMEPSNLALIWFNVRDLLPGQV